MASESAILSFVLRASFRRESGTFNVISSDHAPCKFNHPNGKQRGLQHGNLPYDKLCFIPNGLPGVETRVPLLFSGGVLSGRIYSQKFAEVTSTNPAKVYGLKKKGIIAPGYTAATNFVPHFAGRYLTSNVNIIIFDSDGKPESVSVGSEFKIKIVFATANRFPADRYTEFATRK